MTNPCAWDFLFEAAWKSLIVAGVALALLALLKRRSAAERACVAHFGMAAVLAIPLVMLVGPSLQVEFLAPEPTPVVAAPVEAAMAVDEAEAGDAAAPASSSASPATQAASGPGAGADFALILYVLLAGTMLMTTLVAVLRLFRLRGRASVIVEQGWLTALAHAQRRMGIKHGTALLASRELASPVSWGVLRPIILVSEEALAKPGDAEAVIAHELAHVARFDWLNLLIARVAIALFWFNPFVWLLARQAHQLCEEAADDAVLRADVPCTDYAALLVGTARHESKGMLLAANGVAPRRGSLSLRVRRILEPALPRTPARNIWASSCAAGALLIAGPLAALAPAAPRPPRMPAPTFAAAPVARPAPGAPAAAPAPAPAPAQVAAAPTPLPAPAAAMSVAAPAPTLSPAPLPAPGSTPAPGPAAAPAPPAAPVSFVSSNSPPPLPPHAAAAARAHAVGGASDEEYRTAYPRLRRATADQLVNLKVHGVTPRRLREYTALGYGRLDLDRLVEWGIHGVSPSYIRSIADEGYRGLDPEQLTEFRIMGVSARFIRAVKQAGPAPTPDQLVDMRVHGRSPPRVPEPPGRRRTAPRPHG